MKSVLPGGKAGFKVLLLAFSTVVKLLSLSAMNGPMPFDLSHI
ncbi:hypothetical protein ACVDG8_009540 [Mesorhizobium sp. ORM8.1]